MATFNKNILSSSASGRGILVATNSTAGQLIHTGPTNTAHLDEVWVYVMNNHTSSVDVSVEWGSTTAPNDIIALSVLPASGLVLVVPGLILKGNASPLVVRCFASVVNKVTVHGYVNEIRP